MVVVGVGGVRVLLVPGGVGVRSALVMVAVVVLAQDVVVSLGVASMGWATVAP